METSVVTLTPANRVDKRLRKIAKILNRGYSIVFRIVCVIALLIGLYILYDTAYVFYNSKADRVAAYRPTGESMEEVQQVAKDAIAWITVDDTTIDYPVMQGETNSEYLNKDPFGNYSLSGSIFMDSRNSSDFSDPYNLVYGHHMSGGNMFGALDAFEEASYFETHRTGTLIVDGKTYTIEFFAFLTTSAESKAIFAPTEAEFPDVFIRDTASIYYEPSNDHYIALSTCRSPESIERAVVVGCLIDG